MRIPIKFENLNGIIRKREERRTVVLHFDAVFGLRRSVEAALGFVLLLGSVVWLTCG